MKSVAARSENAKPFINFGQKRMKNIMLHWMMCLKLTPKMRKITNVGQQILQLPQCNDHPGGTKVSNIWGYHISKAVTIASVPWVGSDTC